MDWKKVYSFFKKNKFSFGLFFLSTFIFCFQHYNQFSWDFSSYVLNARYLFYSGSYFEILRPPLVPVILGIFLFLGKFAEYIFIFVSSSLYFVSCIYFADSFFKNQKFGKEFVRFIFYFFSLGVYVLYFGVFAGTELISLSFLILFLASVTRKKVSGHFFALGVLARYNIFIFFPFLFFYKNYKTILKNIGLAILIVLPWLLFNYFSYGNFFASVIDSMTLNILNRGYLWEPFRLIPVLEVIGAFLPLFLLGVFVALKEIIKNKKRYLHLALILVGVLIFYDFLTNPQKKVRFLFNFALPVAYFSSVGLFFIVSKIKNFLKAQKYLVRAFFVLFCLTILALVFFYSGMGNGNVFERAAQDIDGLGLENCEILSPYWVPVNYYSGNVYPLHNENIKNLVMENKTVLIFKNLESMDFIKGDLSFLDEHILLENNDYVFYSAGAQGCSEKYVYNKPYTDYVFCPNLARKFEGFGLKEEARDLCFLFNKN